MSDHQGLDRRPARAFTVAVAALLAAGCGPPRSGSEATLARGGSSGLQPDELDLGADWNAPSGHGPQATNAGSSAAETVWTVVLATFPPEAKPTAPGNFATQLRRTQPQLHDVWTHSGQEGSVVCYGRYDSPQDDAAQRDLKMIKALSVRGAPAFPTALLSRVSAAPSPLQPHALMSVRQRFPNIDPLYTLEVAVWGDFESGKLSPEEIHRQSESYARALRAQGVEAYVYHDDYKRLSSVTVGLFDHTAVDPRTNIYGAAVEALMERFPAKLYNGEQLLEPVDGRDPTRGTRVQRPVLVLVPKR